MVGNDFSEEHLDLVGRYSISLSDLRIVDGKTFIWGGEYTSDFSSRTTLYVDPGIAESCLPILSEEAKKCNYVLFGNTAPTVQLSILDQIDSNPFIMMDTFKLYIDIALKDLKATMRKSDLLCINYNRSIALIQII